MAVFLQMTLIVGATLLPVGLIEAIVRGIKGEQNSAYVVLATLSSLAVFWSLFSTIVLAS